MPPQDPWVRAGIKTSIGSFATTDARLPCPIPLVLITPLATGCPRRGVVADEHARAAQRGGAERRDHHQDRRGDAVNNMRSLFQQTMEADFTAAIERLTGRKVVAFISGNHLEPDVAAELFVLDAAI